jgi:hypothetical protein
MSTIPLKVPKAITGARFSKLAITGAITGFSTVAAGLLEYTNETFSALYREHYPPTFDNKVWNDFRLEGRRFAHSSDLKEIGRLIKEGYKDRAIELCNKLVFVKAIPASGTVVRTSDDYPGEYARFADHDNILRCEFKYTLGQNVLTRIPFDSDPHNSCSPWWIVFDYNR